MTGLRNQTALIMDRPHFEPSAHKKDERGVFCQNGASGGSIGQI